MSQKTLKVLLISLGIIIAGAASYTGARIWKETKKLEKEKDRVLVNQGPKKPEITGSETTEIDTLDWKTYSNEEYGFELKYPKNYTVYETDFSKTYGDKRSLILYRVKFSPTTERGINYHSYDPIDPMIDIMNISMEKAEKWLTEGTRPCENSFIKDVIINNQKGKEIWPCPPGFKNYQVQFIILFHKGKTFELSVDTNYLEVKEVFDQMLSNFKFID